MPVKNLIQSVLFTLLLLTVSLWLAWSLPGGILVVMVLFPAAILYIGVMMLINQRGVSLIYSGEPEKALHLLTTGTRLMPISALMHFNRSTAAFRCRDYHTALVAINRALQLRPDWSYLYINRAFYLAAAGNLDRAYEDTATAIKLLPENPYGYNMRGYVLFLMGDEESGLSGFRQAVKLAPRFSDVARFATAGQAICYYTAGKVGQAKALWRDLVAADASFASMETAFADANLDESFLAVAEQIITALQDEQVISDTII